MHSIYAITLRGKEVRWLPAYSAAVWKETQEKICCMKGSGRKWEWGHIMSHLKSHSGQYGSPSWPGSCSDCSHAADLLLSHLHLFPTYGEWLEVSMLIPGAQALSFISPSKAPQGTQFEQGATFKTGQCLLSGYSIGGFKAKGQPDVYGCTIHSQLQI